MKTWMWLALPAFVLLGVYLYIRLVWFYRDPVRHAPAAENAILAPCDGTVVYVKPFWNGIVTCEKLGEAIPVSEICKAPGYGGDGWVLGVYMSPLDVHFNYAPVRARVAGVVRTQAELNLPMVDLWEYVKLTYLRRAVDLFASRYRLVNERNTIFLEGAGGRPCPNIAMVEIADKFVNKIRCFVKTGDLVLPGQKVSFIDRGSQVDLIVYEKNLKFYVKPGDRVIGGVTVVAEYSG